MALNLLDFMTGFVLTGLMAILIEGKGALTFSGNLAAILVGTLIYGFDGMAWLVLILAFFFSSSLLSNYKISEKTAVAGEKFQKFGARDFWQVLANGGLPAVLSVAFFITPDPRLFIAFAGVLAATTADTWGTEMGVLSKQRPRMITTFKEVETGTSGAFSLLGNVFAILGAVFIGLVAFAVLPWASIEPVSKMQPFALVATIAVAGLAGALVDSIAGATVQAIYYCPVCKKETERPMHRCGTKTRKIRGLDWVDNDSVNLLAAIAGAVASVALFQLLA